MMTGWNRTALAWAQALLVVLALLTTTTGLQAQTSKLQDDIPPELHPWIPWVMAELGDQACANLKETKQCVWPGHLHLDLSAEGGSFESKVFVGARATHVLPGGKGAWPQRVEVNGRKAPLFDRAGRPAIELERGNHTISGRFTWTRVPETLEVGDSTALLDVAVDGQAVPLVKREGGRVWLKGLALTEGAEDEPELVDLSVFRQIRDGAPMLVETRLMFRVSGKARELSLPAPLLPGTLPLRLEGDLALALEADGSLRVQLMPGRHTVTLVARAAGMPKELASQAHRSPWPETEFWTFKPNEHLRAVEVSGPSGIDASRTELPEAWRSDSAYAVSDKDILRLETTRRGQQQVPSNRLALEREYWLDEAASAFTVVDTINGEMHRDWRLALLSGKLGEASVGGESQLITHPAIKGPAGVEVRDGQLALRAVSRVEHQGQLAAVGWSEDVDSLSARVHLPPGWDLLFASGVDETSDTWVSRWDLFAVFFVLVLTLAMIKLAGPIAGAATATALILLHGEAGAPEYVWLPLVVLATLVGLLGKHWLRTWLRLAFFATLLVAGISSVTFSVDQVRHALYPHLDASFGSANDFDLAMPGAMQAVETEMVAADEEKLEDFAEAPAPPEPMLKRQSMAVDKEGGAGTRAKSSLLRGGGAQRANKRDTSNSGLGSYAQKQYKPDAVVQTGPGVPEATSSTWHLNWSGPVVKDHQMRLYLLSPAMMRVLTALRLIALGALAWFVWTVARGQGSSQTPTKQAPRSDRVSSSPTASVTTAVLLAAGLLCYPSSTIAAEPSDARLQELKNRLEAVPQCGLNCLSVSELALEVDEKLRVSAEVHASARTSYKLPGPAKALITPVVQVDGKKATALRLAEDGAYYLRLERGVHRVELSARLLTDRVTLDLGSAPHHITTEIDGWVVSGINDLGQAPGGSVTLQRTAQNASSSDVEKSTDTSGSTHAAVPPSYLVTRTVGLGVTGVVTTRIERISDASSPEELRLPLLRGERLTTAEVTVEPATTARPAIAVISFAREETVKLLRSTLALPKNGKPLALELKAPEKSRQTEIWKLECGVVWHCQTKGVIPTQHLDDNRSSWTFHPWPGESLQVEATEPTPADGKSLTVQKATLNLTPGVRMSRSKLELGLRTTRSTVHTVTIPQTARLERVTVDGTVQAVKSEAGKVRVSLRPGQHHVVVEWHEPKGITSVFGAPHVHTGAPGVNHRVVIQIPGDRWLLWAGGPSQGPAILFWGYLVLLALAAWLLPRLPFATLTRWQWLLLGLGLTQVPAAMAVFIAGWFFAVGSRPSWPTLPRTLRNLLQLALVGYTGLFLILLSGAVYEGLVSQPDMEIQGAGSYGNTLTWYVDRSSGALPHAWVVSVTLWVWRAFMLAWALWLARSLLRWLRQGFELVTEGGFWLPKPPRAVTQPTQATATSAPAAEPNSTASANESTAPAPTESPDQEG